MIAHRQRHAASLRRCFHEFSLESVEALKDGDLLAAYFAAYAGVFFFIDILIFDN